MYSAEPADRRRAPIDSRSAPGAQTIEPVRFETHRRSIARQCQQALHIRLYIVKIQRFARTAPLLRPARASRNAGQRFNLRESAALLRSLQPEFLAHLEQPNPRLLTPQI